MKTIIITLVLSFTGLCHAQFISTDDKLHFGAGALISATTYTVVYTTTKDKKKAFWFSLGASALAGLAKEVYDSNKELNRFDTGELVATSLGGLTASTTISLFVGKNKNKKKRRNVALVN
ncbi:hypothetical protein Q4Q35_14405 [Flavivirga aquimarina]|uniref:Lipoprotein n=1 Tax=Flavivirga aquimarina TaxID=2027862 RepID=A0ABT8WD09_9FLAO|nr:hypothetical protein [Flavivirga aquimarina]MDO5970996.1 hypothetical protein [Flavivirga aquimarina]